MFILERVSTPRISKTTLSMVIVRVFRFILLVTAVNLEYQPDCDMKHLRGLVGQDFSVGLQRCFLRKLVLVGRWSGEEPHSERGGILQAP